MRPLQKILESFDSILEKKNFVNEVFVNVSSVKSSYPNLIFHDRTLNDSINKALLDDLQKAAQSSNTKITIDFAKTDHDQYTDKGVESRHWRQSAVDIDWIYFDGKKYLVTPKNKDIVEKFTNALASMGYTKNSEGKTNPKSFLTFGFKGHSDHIHVSNLTDVSHDGNLDIKVKPETQSSDSDDEEITTDFETPNVEDKEKEFDNLIKNMTLSQVIKNLPSIALKENIQKIKTLLK